MYKVIKFSIFAFALMIFATANVNAQFNLVSVDQLNLDTLGTRQTGANILYTEEDDIVVVWGDAQEANPYFNVFMTISTDFGQTFCEPIKVNDGTGYAFTDGEGVIGIAENSSGHQVFCWTDMRHGTNNKDVYGRVRRHNGAFSPVFRINDDLTLFHQYLPNIIQVRNSDTLVVDWLDGRLCQQGCLSVFASMSTDGGYSWGANIRASVQPFGIQASSQSLPDVAIGDDGQVMVAFRNNVDYYRDIYCAKSNSDFTSFYSPVRVDSSNWWLSTCPKTGPSLIQLESGDWVCAYADGRTGTYKIYTSRSADNGASFGDEILVGGDHWQNYPQLLEIGYGWLLIAFQERLPNSSNTRILGSISYDAGMSWGPPFEISDDVISEKSNVQLAFDGVNNLYAVWVDNRNGNRDIFFAKLEAAATLVEEDPSLPESVSILKAYPNPFNASCKITVTDNAIDHVDIYNITGRLVEQLELSSGEAVWDASAHASGVYFARVASDNILRSVKLLYLR